MDAMSPEATTIGLVRALHGAIVGAALVAGTVAADAQTWPTREIRVITPFTAGSASDTVGRIVLDQVSREIGQAFVVENRPGAGGTVGTEFVAKADPNGYTLLLSSASLGSQIVFNKKLPYDAIHDFASVSLLGIQPSVLVAAPLSGFTTVADLIATAKARPGALTFGSAGVGSASHLAGERFRLAAHIDVRHIPFRGAEVLTEVMAGRIDFTFVPVAPAVPLITDRKLVVLAVSTPKRAALLPNVPTVSEAGYPDAQYLFWTGLSAPVKTPRQIIDVLHDKTQRALTMSAVREKLAKFGVEPLPMSVEQFDKFVRDDIAATVKLAKDAHIELSD
jgi:tripartite-type tricarboxylate transporter receptor subunit TctC